LGLSLTLGRDASIGGDQHGVSPRRVRAGLCLVRRPLPR
jgi:hypothetical protein